MDKAKRVSRIALASVAVGVTLTGLKLVVGLATGSLGILSEAAHSLLDLGAALITFFAVRAAVRPPDADHQFGHGKVENLSALAETLLLLATCVWIVWEAVERLAGKAVHVDAGVWSFVVMGVSLVLDVVISRVLYAGARKYNSQALEADALHYASDILSSAVVVLGLIGVRLGYPILDPLAAIGVAVLVTVASGRLGKRTIDALLDRAPAGLTAEIDKRIRGRGIVEGVERVRVRRSGPVTFVDLVVSLGRLTPLDRSHEIADRLEAEVRTVIPGCDVMVHFHPSRARESFLETVRAIAARFPEIEEVHDLQSYRSEESGRYFLSLHARLPPSLTVERAHDLADRFEAALKRELPDVDEVSTHMETHAAVGGGGRRYDIPPEKLAALSADVMRDPRLCGIHDVCLHTSSGGTLFSCHVLTRRDVPLDEAHQLTTEVERKIKAMFPDVDDVVVHAEPVPAA
jgi:cation diffusion facilitator family transporter